MCFNYYYYSYYIIRIINNTTKYNSNVFCNIKYFIFVTICINNYKYYLLLMGQRD